LKVAYVLNMHQTEMNDFMPQSDTRASRSMGMDGWVGGLLVGERLGYGGHNDEVDDFCFLSLFQSSTCPGLVFFLVFSLFGERMDLRLYLCQSQRLVKKFSCVFYFLFLSGLN
jgi:hypothetical protein